MRIMSMSLLASILLFAYAPVCGNVADPNPQACCGQDSACRDMSGSSERPDDPAECCKRSQATYPIGWFQFPMTVASDHVLTPVFAGLPPVIPLSASFDSHLYAQRLLKIPLRDLYLLTATYRI